MTVAAPLYACGCSLADVGQDFRQGVLVCPVHGEPTAPYEHPSQPFQGRVRLELIVRGESREAVQSWVDTLTETLLAEDIVLGLDCSDER